VDSHRAPPQISNRPCHDHLLHESEAQRSSRRACMAYSRTLVLRVLSSGRLVRPDHLHLWWQRMRLRTTLLGRSAEF